MDRIQNTGTTAASSAPGEYDLPSLGAHLDRDTTRSFPVHADRAFGEGPANLARVALADEDLDARIDNLLDRLVGGQR